MKKIWEKPELVKLSISSTEEHTFAGGNDAYAPGYPDLDLGSCPYRH